MNLEYIKGLVRILEESSIGEIQVFSWGRHYRVSKNNHPESVSRITRPSAKQETQSIAPASQPGKDLHREIKSPMVGTFYRALRPGAVPCVEVNYRIKPGDTLCFIEAMKLMNEIRSEVRGRVARILLDSGEPVEYGQTLFLVQPD